MYVIASYVLIWEMLWLWYWYIVSYVYLSRQGFPVCPFYVFLFACFVEVLQYFQLVETLGITNRALRIILGSTFDWKDIACYGAGCIFIFLFEQIFRRR